MQMNEIPGINQLSGPEKILLVEDLWDNIAANEANVPTPDSHLIELDRRLESYRAHPGNLLSLSELQRNLQSRK